MKKTHRQNGEWSGGMAREPMRGNARRCDRAAEWEPLLYDFAEGLTDAQTGQAVQRHTAECAYCRGALEDIRWMTSALRESVPEPKYDISTRVMDAIRAEEESDGHIVAQTVDARTGRVLSAPKEKYGIRRVMRNVSGIAAAVLLVIGLMYLLPLLRTGSGAASQTPDILGGMQSCEESRFSDGVFVGDPVQPTAETAAGSAVSETVLTENQYPVILYVPGLTGEQILSALSSLTAADGTPARITKTADGYLVSPLHAYEEAQALLIQTYPGHEIEIFRAEIIPDSDTGDVFCIQTDAPR